jgi:transcription elongation factor GreB
VRFGATVTVANDGGSERTYTIVGIDEADASRGLISWVSPLGRALLRRSEGDVVTVRTPRGDEEIEIVGVRFAAWKA